MSKAINVPQGHSARLTKTSLNYEITGLYTDSFSSCNIIAVISSERLVLIHADLQTAPKTIQAEVEWVGEGAQVILIFRKQWKDALTSQMIRELSALLKNKKIVLKEMDDQHDGAYLSFNASEENTIHPHIKKYPLRERPPELLRHPQEQQLLAVQQIEQVIGLRARQATKKNRLKYLTIFDGLAWETMRPYELVVNDDHPMTKEELDFINPEDDYLTITGKLAGIVASFDKQIVCMGKPEDLSMPVGVELEGYLNNFDALKLLKRNLWQLINPKNANSIFRLEKCDTSEDKKICADLKLLVLDVSSTADQINSLITGYMESAPETSFKKQLTDEYKTFYRHYSERMVYVTQGQDYKAMQERAIALSKSAKAEFLKQNFSAAINLFRESLMYCSYAHIKHDEQLATTYYNLGRSLYKHVINRSDSRDVSQQFEEAKTMLANALTLRTEYVKSKPEEIKKVQNALNDCDTAISNLTVQVAKKTLVV